jgi:phosphopantothenoylcysteine synthetase/decarboxylase
MIKGLQGSGHVVVNDGDTSVPYVNSNPNNPMQGMLRLNGTNMQVFDGSTWMTLSTSYATVALNPTTEEVIDWARQKMQEDQGLHERMKQHPGLKQAYEQFKIMDILTLEEKHGQKA